MTTQSKLRKGFKIGSWDVLPDRGLVRDGDTEIHLEPKVMNVLVALAEKQDEVVTKDELIELVWQGRAMNDEPLNRAISELRKGLGDESKNPSYVQTIPRVGYRLMVPVVIPDEPAMPSSDSVWRPKQVIVVVALIVAAIVVLPPAIELIKKILGMDPPSPPSVESMAITPFLCADNTENYLCFGFSEELASTLWQSGRPRMVKLRTYDSSGAVPPAVCDVLDVDAILFGTVQRVGDQLRISAELVDCQDGSILVSETLDGPVSEVFRLQENVATVVTHSVFPGSREPLRSASKPSSSEAFIAYAQGLVQFEIRSRDSINESIEKFEQTIRLDPMFGPAYLRLAHSLLLLPEYDTSLPIEDMYDRAAAITEQGIAADPSIRATAETVFGFIHHKRGEWMQATSAFEIAVNATTVYPISHNWYSRFLGTVGRMEDALEQAQSAYAAAPDNPSIVSRLAVAHMWLGQYEAAGRYFGEANKMRQDSPIHYLAYSLYLIRTGDMAAARQYAKDGLEDYGFDSSWVDPVFDGFENPSLATRSADLVARLEADTGLARYIIMALWGVLGDADRAMATAHSIEGIGQDFELGFEVMFSNELAIMRDHRDFPALLDKIGLTEYWAAIGCRWADARLICE